MDKYYIPQHLDTPRRIALLTMDELLVFAIPFGVLFWVDNAILLGSIIGASLVACLKKLKGEEGQAYIWQLLYWYLPPIFIYKVTPPSYLRQWIG